MLRNYLKIAWRNVSKHKLFSLINIFGLASGMVICLLALMRIKGTYDYDTFHPNAERSYRINTVYTPKKGTPVLEAFTALPVGEYLKKNYTEIERATRVVFAGDAISTDAKSLPAKEAFVDADFYNIFGFKLAKGSPATAPQTVVLTAETAIRFFGTADPIGQTLTLGKRGDFIVTGVLAVPPHPSHLRFDALASMPQNEQGFTDWTNTTAFTYVQLKKGFSKAALEPVLRNIDREAARLNPQHDYTFHFEAQPLTAIVPAMKPITTTADEVPFRNLLGLALLGGAMLLLAFFNYVNLTLARSLDRAREIGVRKVAGAVRRQLIVQFLTESVLIAMLSFLVALLLLKPLMALPTIHSMTYDVSPDWKLWALFILFTLVTGLIAGWIPARVLSSFQPVRVLKGTFNAKLFGGVGLRKAMTVTQFALSLAAMVTLSVFYIQSRYMATADYGFNRTRIISIPIQAQAYPKTAAAFASVAGVEQVAGTSESFGFFGGDGVFINREPGGDSLAGSSYSVSPSFISAMGLQFVAGENIPLTNTEHRAAFVVVNEEACRRLKFENPRAAVGEQIWTADSMSYRISGVVNDFNYASFQRNIRPLMLLYDPAFFRTLQVQVAAGSEKSIVPKLEAAWKKLYPHQVFEMAWFDKQLYYQHLHIDDLVFIGLLTAMALSIACLGLLGMVMYIAKNRAKEVSIRKVMGAAVWQVVALMSREFLMLLLLAVCIGLPLGYLGGFKFLQQYAYRIPISFGLLAGCAGALLLLGGVTIGWQTFRTAVTNPVKNLHAE